MISGPSFKGKTSRFWACCITGSLRLVVLQEVPYLTLHVFQVLCLVVKISSMDLEYSLTHTATTMENTK